MTQQAGYAYYVVDVEIIEFLKFSDESGAQGTRFLPKAFIQSSRVLGRFDYDLITGYEKTRVIRGLFPLNIKQIDACAKCRNRWRKIKIL